MLAGPTVGQEAIPAMIEALCLCLHMQILPFVLILFVLLLLLRVSSVSIEPHPSSVTMASLLVTEREGRKSQSNYPQVMLIVVSFLSRLSICKVSSDEFHYLLLMCYCIAILRRESCRFNVMLRV